MQLAHPKVAQLKLGAYSAPSLLLVSSTHPARMPDGPAKKPGGVYHCVSIYPVYICVFLHESADDNATEMHGAKARWGLYKKDRCCFEQILKATPHKIAAVQPLTNYLPNHPSKMNKTC